MRIKQRTQPPRSPGSLLTSSASDSLLACPWERCQRDYSPFLPRAPSAHPVLPSRRTGNGSGGVGERTAVVCVQHVCACVQCFGSRDSERWGGGGGAGEKAEQVSTEPAWPGWVELGGAVRSHSRFPRGNPSVGVHVRVSVFKCVCGLGGYSASPLL